LTSVAVEKGLAFSSSLRSLCVSASILAAKKPTSVPQAATVFTESIMVRKKSNTLSQILERFSLKATKATGTSMSFILALSVIIVWGITGPLFHFSDTWQLVINTSTTIVTFLMVFLIQRTQNKDAQAIHIKLNEIVAAMEGASNRLIDVEDLTEEEIETLHKHYQKLVQMAKQDMKLTQSHSVEEAEARHNMKHSKHRHKTA
jgi:low affinity Fe/Cu permease